MIDRDTHFQGFATLLADELDRIDLFCMSRRDFHQQAKQIIAQRAYDLIQSGCIAINTAQMQQGVRLHPHAMLRAVQDLMKWPESSTDRSSYQSS